MTKSLREIFAAPLLGAYASLARSDKGLWRASQWMTSKREDRNRYELFRCSNGLRMRLRLRDYPDGSLRFGAYEVQTVRLIKRLLRSGGYAIDVGANIGYLSLIMASRVGKSGKVQAIEPVPSTYERLRENISLNAMDKIIDALQVAATAAESEVVIYERSDEASNRHVLASQHPVEGANEYVVRGVQIDTVVDHDRPVDLVKLDIEGAEYQALQGMQETLRRWRPQLIIEHNPRIGPSGEFEFERILDLIDAAGYRSSIKAVRSGWPSLSRSDLKSGRVGFCNLWISHG